MAEVAERLENVLKMRQTSCQLLLNAKLVKIMIENVDWASLSRSLKSSTSGLNPLAGFERMMNPLGNITGLINHLKHLTEIILNKQIEHQDSAVVKELLKCYQKLFSINNVELIRPILKGTTLTFSKFLENDAIVSHTSIDASIMNDIEKVFNTLCTLINVKYNKEYSLEFLTEIATFIEKSLQSSRPQIRDSANKMWTVTFAGIPKEKLPENLLAALKRSSSGGVRAGVSSGSENSFPDSSNGSLSQQVKFVRRDFSVGLNLLFEK